MREHEILEARRAARRQKRQRDQMVTLGIIAAIVVIALGIVWYFLLRSSDSNQFAYNAGSSVNGASPSNAGVSTTTTAETTGTATTGSASLISPQQRNKMYSSAPAMTIDPNKSYRATISTAKGDIVVDLYPKDAPQHVNNFVFLARDGFYNGLTFHRVEPGFVIQGGDPLGNGTGGPGYTIPPEIKGKHTKGALAMARRGGPPQTTPSSGSQFYVTLAATPHLDGAYTVFGQTTPETIPVTEQIRVGDVINSITIEEK